MKLHPNEMHTRARSTILDQTLNVERYTVRVRKDFY